MSIPAPPNIQTRELIERVAAVTMRWPFRMWAFGEAVALRGLLAASAATGNPEWRGFVYALLRTYAGRGAGKSPDEHVAPGAELLIAYQNTGEEIFLQAARSLAELHASFPQNRHGARMHRPDLAGWRRQIWVDCIDAEAPFLARLGAVTGENRYFHQAADELLAYARLLQDRDTGLFYHGHEEACGINGQLWARGNGWALMGLTETLAFLPHDFPARPELTAILQRLCIGLLNTQDPNGLWHTLLLDPDSPLESTLAAMVAFALRFASDQKLFDTADFKKMTESARAAVLSQIDESGTLQLVTDATPVASIAMYRTRPFGVFPWGQGPLLLLLCREMEAERSPSLSNPRTTA